MGCCYATSQFPEETEPSNEVTRLEPLQLERSGAIWGLEEGVFLALPILATAGGAPGSVWVQQRLSLFVSSWGGIGARSAPTMCTAFGDRSIRVL